MPRRGRHRTRLPVRLLAMVAALLVGGTAVVLGGTALAEGSSGEDILSSLTGSSRSDDEGSDDGSASGDDGSGEDASGDDGSGGDSSGGDGSGDGGPGEGRDRDRDDRGGSEDDGGQDGRADRPEESERTADQEQKAQRDAREGRPEDPFPGREQAADADDSDFVEILDVEENGNIGEGGVFSGGSYTVDCGTSGHRNSDNYMAAPGKRNGAQHVHDYVGNTSTDAFSDDDSLEAAGTTCANGENSTFFWPVLRDTDGTGPDVGEDGGSLDGNVGEILTPASAVLSFHGHGDQDTLDAMAPMPHHLMMIMGNAKAATQDGENANAKYTCTGHEQRVTDRYPICPAGSNLVRMLDYPSCWDGQNIESDDNRSHMAYPDSSGNCGDGMTPVPALRVTLTYDQPEGRSFQIDSFPDNRHAPATDHSDYENYADPSISEAGADCIRAGERCRDLEPQTS